MKKITAGLIVVWSKALIISGCASMNKIPKGAVVGTARGGAIGAFVGRAAGIQIYEQLLVPRWGELPVR